MKLVEEEAGRRIIYNWQRWASFWSEFFLQVYNLLHVCANQTSEIFFCKRKGDVYHVGLFFIIWHGKSYSKKFFVFFRTVERLFAFVPVNKSGHKKCFFSIWFFKSGQFLRYFFRFGFRSGQFLLYEFWGVLIKPCFWKYLSAKVLHSSISAHNDRDYVSMPYESCPDFHCFIWKLIFVTEILYKIYINWQGISMMI